MVPGHCEAGKLLLDDKVGKLFLLREFITEPEAVVIEAEAYDHCDIIGPAAAVEVFLCGEGDSHLVVVVADMAFLSPYRLPGLVKGRAGHIGESESVVEAYRVGILSAEFLVNGLLELASAKDVTH